MKWKVTIFAAVFLLGLFNPTLRILQWENVRIAWHYDPGALPPCSGAGDAPCFAGFEIQTSHGTAALPAVSISASELASGNFSAEMQLARGARWRICAMVRLPGSPPVTCTDWSTATPEPAVD
jgi:hypothetical protein